MKKLLFIVMLLLPISLFAKGDNYPFWTTIDTVYEDAQTRLIKSAVLLYEGKTTKQLHDKFKAYCGANFNNASKVITSDVEDEITVDYIDKWFIRSILGGYLPEEWHIRIIAKFKENKIKIMIFDDKSNYKPPTSANFNVSTPDRLYALFDYCKAKDGHAKNHAQSDGLYDFVIGLRNKIIHIDNYMKSETKLSSDNW